MPTYSYRCSACGDAFDIRQSMMDDPLTVCGKCGGELKKIINSVGISFKGSGFYRTDSHSSSALPAKEPIQTTGTEPSSNTSAPTAASETKAALKAPGRLPN